LRNIRRTIEIQLPPTLELQRDSFVLEVVKGPEIQLLAFIFCLPGLGIKVAVMIACDNDLLSVGKSGQPVKLLLYFFNSTGIRQVPGVNQHVAIRDGYCVRMGI
jgi:hypothetical protein